MFELKAAGALCILAASALAGLWLEGRMKQRWKFLQEVCETLGFLEQDMLYHRCMIQEAFRSAASHCSTGLADILLNAAEGIEGKEIPDFTAIWETAVGKKLPPELLTEREAEAVRELASAFCASDVMTQKTLLEKYRDHFRMMSSEEEAVYRDKGKLCRSLSAAAGIFLIILLI